MTDLAHSDGFLGRQPILDRAQRLFAYELLFREGGRDNYAAFADGNLASARVIANAFSELGVEAVNRYENHLINSAQQAVAMVERVGADNIFVHLDTYHMNIEESDLFQPFLDVGDRLGYVHIGESHRGYLGTGSVDFESTFRALARMGYDGPITFESFSSAVVSPTLSNTLGIWRNLWSDGDDLAAHANRFIRDHILAVKTIELH